jgi:MFS family permease
MTLLRCNVLTVLTVMPAFLLGAMSLEIDKDLDLGPGAIGIAVSVMFTVSATASKWLGGFVQNFGSQRAMALAGSVSGTALLLCGMANGMLWLVGALIVAGLANALAHPAINSTIADSLPVNRQGLAFGIKQSSVPAATLLCSAAVPAVALVSGWRSAFWVVGAFAFGSVIASPRGPTPSLTPSRHAQLNAGWAPHREDLSGPEMRFIALIAGAGMAAATSLGVFLLATGVKSGVSTTSAALTAGLCSALCIACRVGLGWWLDRGGIRDGYVLIAGLLLAGSVGYLLLSIPGPWAFIVGAVVAYGLGWSWTGILQASIVADNRHSVASATGKLMSGTSLGAALGPLTFGLIASASSFSWAWGVAAVFSLVAGLSLATWRIFMKEP